MASSDVLAIERLGSRRRRRRAGAVGCGGLEPERRRLVVLHRRRRCVRRPRRERSADRDGRGAAVRRRHRLDLDGARRRGASPSRHRQPARRCLRRFVARGRPHRRCSTRRRRAPPCTRRSASSPGSRSSAGRAVAATIAAAETESGHRARGPSTSETLIALDRSACGVDRALLLRSFLARPATRAWLAPRGDGFALRRAGRRAVQVGPIVAADDAAALELLGARARRHRRPRLHRRPGASHVDRRAP